MKKVLLAIISLLMLTACSLKIGDKSNVEVASDQRQLNGFERIVQQGSMDVKYQQGDQFSVVVKTRKSDVNKVETRVENSTLFISMKEMSKLVNFGWTDGDDVVVYVTSPDLIGVEVNGSGDFKCRTPLDTDHLDMILKGSGDIEFSDIICDDIAISVVGSGDVKVQEVKAQKSAISLVGSGEIKVNQQHVAQTMVELKGSGEVKVNFNDCGLVKSSLLGSGEITLSGNVAEHQSSKQGSGDLDVEKLAVKNK